MASLIVHRIPLPTPYPVGRINAYLMPGPPVTLIDTGVRSNRSIKALELGFESANLSISDLDAVLITHPHHDHSGAAAELARRTGVPVYCHSEAVRDLAKEHLAFGEALSRYGAPDTLLEILAGLEQMNDRFGEPLGDIPGLTILGDGEPLDVGEHQLIPVHTPGHHPGHLCVRVAGQPTVFCGDLILADITPNPLPHFDPSAERGRVSSLSLYLKSLARLESMGPLEGLPGHDTPVADTAAAAREARKHILERSQTLWSLCANNVGSTLFAIAQKLFGEENPLGQALALSEVLAHCDLLEDMGRIRVDHDRGKVVEAIT
jgi:glyoxylase-like metal-dependent hydrolase (beta-lactamase superfamily II)